MSSITAPQKTAVDRLAMEKLFGELGKRPKLPRLQPPERINSNVRGEAGVSYTLRDKWGEVRIVNHAEMRELHRILADLQTAVTAVNATTQPAFSTN